MKGFNKAYIYKVVGIVCAICMLISTIYMPMSFTVGAAAVVLIAAAAVLVIILKKRKAKKFKRKDGNKK